MPYKLYYFLGSSVVNEPGRAARDSFDATDRPSLRVEDRPLASPHPGVVELTGIEPVASWLQTRRSPR
jgi:hypothetical protein